MRRTRVRELESLIEDYEARIKQMEELFTNGATTQQYEEYADITRQLEDYNEEYLNLCEEEDKYKDSISR